MKSVKYLVLIFLILFPTISSAAYKYIEVTSTKEQNQLWVIKSKLNNLGLGMLSLKTKNNFIIYTGPFKSNNSAKATLKLIKPIFKNANIIGLDVVKKIKTSPTVEVLDTNETNQSLIIHEEIQEESLEDNYDGFFLGLSMGIASTPYKHSTLLGVVIIDTPEKYNFSYSLEGGYNFQNNVLFSCGYLRTDSSDISTDNIILSLGHKYKLTQDIAPFFNILAGHSILKRKTIPLHNPQTVDKQSESFISGFSIGVIYEEYEEIKPYISYRYVIMNHTASLESSTGTSNLKHTRMYSLEVGVRF